MDDWLSFEENASAAYNLIYSKVADAELNGSVDNASSSSYDKDEQPAVQRMFLEKNDLINLTKELIYDLKKQKCIFEINKLHL